MCSACYLREEVHMRNTIGILCIFFIWNIVMQCNMQVNLLRKWHAQCNGFCTAVSDPVNYAYTRAVTKQNSKTTNDLVVVAKYLVGVIQPKAIFNIIHKCKFIVISVRILGSILHILGHEIIVFKPRSSIFPQNFNAHSHNILCLCLNLRSTAASQWC